MTINLSNKINETGWKDFTNSSPFLDYDFFLSLEESGVIGQESGWQAVYIEEAKKSLLYTFVKNHSYGEYIFDWDWANFYGSRGIPYYPKLTSMIPFTSATTSHFLNTRSENIMNNYEEFFSSNPYSSSHFLFLTESEKEFFKSYDYHLRDSFQYHFCNDNYKDFDDFLSHLKSKKAKQIRKERCFDQDITFKKISGDEITDQHYKEMYQFYLTTISKKNAIPYLNETFFKLIFKRLANSICYIQANRNEEVIAGALYFFSGERLYGRYWGSVEDIPNLHFELCYYQGIEFCIEKKLSVFEAGAQGEHKISRGFRPVKTFSAHKIKIPAIHTAIEGYIKSEREQINNILPELSSRLPFK
ncbi:MAG: N-acetyltransferase [Bacteriovoracaceae bacterium]|nr:N-acetyltransferase [Bacteriovoracaceae bacterium]